VGLDVICCEKEECRFMKKSCVSPLSIGPSSCLAALSRRRPAFAGTYRDSSVGEDSSKRNALRYTFIKMRPCFSIFPTNR